MNRLSMTSVIVTCIMLSSMPAKVLGAQESLVPFNPPSGRIVIQERSDFSRYEDNRYVGHSYREARLDLSLEHIPGAGQHYSGEVLVLEETLRDQRIAAKRLDAAFGIDFSVYPGGLVRFTVDEGYPILRGVPSSPTEPVPQGGRWTGEGFVVVRPRSGSMPTRIPVLVEYQYIGKLRYGDKDALSLRARYAIRYSGGDRLGDVGLRSATGGRTADITIDAGNGSTLFVRENCDETYTYSDGSTVRLKGFILHFYRGSLPSDRVYIASLLGGTIDKGEVKLDRAVTGTSLSQSDEGTSTDVSPLAIEDETKSEGAGLGAFELAFGDKGVVMLLFDLRFVADSDELLLGDRGRLDIIAASLSRIESKTFLVEGHSADVGRPAGQYELSERRARRIVDEMVSRGIPATRFVYRGLGADHPISDNDSEEHRARNRRVEITILD